MEMKYMGSKSKYAKYLLPHILANRQPGQWYVEPFVGGCNMIDKVNGNRLGSDKNYYLILMWMALQQNAPLPIVDRETYVKAREQYNGKIGHGLNDYEVGYIGWMGSFNGRFFDGGYSGKTKTRDYIAEQIKNTHSQIEAIKGVKFAQYSYSSLPIPHNSIIYCDPPYQGTKQYSSSKDFNHDNFWEWCRKQKSDGHQIFISEYEAPSDFKLVIELNAVNSLNTTKTYKIKERLFTL